MSDTIRAKQFIVVDDAGKDRAKLGMQNGAVGLELLADDGQVGAELQLSERGDTTLVLRTGHRSAELQINDHRVSLRLKDEAKTHSSCGMSVDDAGAWLSADANPDVGVRILSKNDGQVTSVWLSETFTENNQTYVRTRYLRPDPDSDEISSWQTST